MSAIVDVTETILRVKSSRNGFAYLYCESCRIRTSTCVRAYSSFFLE